MVQASRKQLDWDMCVAMGVATGPHRKTSNPHQSAEAVALPTAIAEGVTETAPGEGRRQTVQGERGRETFRRKGTAPSLTNSVGRMAQVRHQGVVDRGHSRLTRHIFSAATCSNKKVL